VTTEVDRLALIARILALPEDYRLQFVRSLSRAQRREWNERWAAWAHSGQRIDGDDWRVALIRAGRGFGKTRAGADG
jgi:phage terminase large subunit-like protein